MLKICTTVHLKLLAFIMNLVKVFCFSICMNILFLCNGITGKKKCKTNTIKMFSTLNSSMQKVNIKNNTNSSLRSVFQFLYSRVILLLDYSVEKKTTKKQT